jgi:hypothetical protein
LLFRRIKMDSRFRGNDGFGGYSRFPEVPGRRSAEAIPAFAGMTMGADAIFVGMTILEGLQAFARASKGIAHKVRSCMCASH